jgi:hypothetical protein
MKHSDAISKIRLALADMGAISLPQTVGMFYDPATVARIAEQSAKAGRPVMGNARPIRIGLPGTSDIIACHKGRWLGVEIKVDRDQQRPEQKNFQAAIEAQGGLYVLARFTDTLDGVETLRRALA